MKILSLSLVLAVGTISLPAAADDDDPAFGQIRQWVREGRVLPLQQILDRYPARLNGRLLDLDVERDGETVIYELEILRPDGRVVERKVDARSGRLLPREDAD